MRMTLAAQCPVASPPGRSLDVSMSAASDNGALAVLIDTRRAGSSRTPACYQAFDAQAANHPMARTAGMAG